MTDIENGNDKRGDDWNFWRGQPLAKDNRSGFCGDLNHGIYGILVA